MLMTTPHPQYPVLGVSSVGVATSRNPSVDVNIYWPEKDLSLSMAAVYPHNGEARAKFALKTPVDRLRRIQIDAGYTLPQSLVTFPLT